MKAFGEIMRLRRHIVMRSCYNERVWGDTKLLVKYPCPTINVGYIDEALCSQIIYFIFNQGSCYVDTNR